MSRVQKQVRLENLGELTEEDLVLIEENRHTKPPVLKSLRSTHHNLARLLALGLPPGEAAIATGLSASRVSILQSDPAFQDLLKVHQNQKDLLAIDVMEKVAEVTSLAIEEMRDRILDEPENVGTNQLLEIANSGLDRLGHSPVQRHDVRHFDVSALKAAADAARRGKVSYREVGEESELITLRPVEEIKTVPCATEGEEVREECPELP